MKKVRKIVLVAFFIIVVAGVIFYSQKAVIAGGGDPQPGKTNCDDVDHTQQNACVEEGECPEGEICLPVFDDYNNTIDCGCFAWEPT